MVGAISDVRNAEEEAKDPPLFKKLIAKGSVEQEAMRALFARKKIEQQEKDLRELIVWRWGTEEYTAMMRDRVKIKTPVNEQFRTNAGRCGTLL